MTLLAKAHGGKYPEDTVKTTLMFGTNVPAHGDAKMPVWGDLFRSVDGGSAVSALRIRSLRGYIKTLQAK